MGPHIKFGSHKICSTLLICTVLGMTIFNIVLNFNFVKDSCFSKPLTFDSKGTDLNQSSQIKTILFWTGIWDRNDFYFGVGEWPFQKYCNGNLPCKTTTDRNKLNESDALIFHPREIKLNDMPSYAYKNRQKWVFWLVESPENTFTDLNLIPDIFNLTMTYRTDSDIFMPYGNTEKLLIKVNSSETQNVQGRKLVAWLVSHCDTTGKREAFVEKLSKEIPIDIFGKCGNMCQLASANDTCERMIARSYKFYLAFENSICKDYVTEKFFRSLDLGIVPVVFGGANYSAIAPPHSYINTMNFSTPHDLAEYLKMLDKNDDLYMEYHKWRSDYKILNFDDFIRSGFCELCRKLHTDDSKTFYQDMPNWWTVKGNCTKS